jgi:HAD superfamily hydrolase (TIGR01509 family)
MVSGSRTDGRKIRAVLFDLDGTLLDSEPVHIAVEEEFLASYGITYDDALKAAYIGRSAEDFFLGVEGLFPGSRINQLPMDERIKSIDDAYLACARQSVKMFPGTYAIAKEVSGRGVRLAIASSSSPDIIETMLLVHELNGLFPVRVSAFEVKNGKPAPDIFLEAARRLGEAPEHCLVFEDSRYGVAAAKEAGMACVALPAPGARNPEDFLSAAIVVAGGAAAIDPDLILKAFDWG